MSCLRVSDEEIQQVKEAIETIKEDKPYKRTVTAGNLAPIVRLSKTKTGRVLKLLDDDEQTQIEYISGQAGGGDGRRYDIREDYS